MLPRAHGIPLRRVMSASQPEAVQVQQQQQPDSQAAAPPPSSIQQETNVARDGSNRALVLAPENCKMIEHYAGLYGVKDVKSWVHHNCSFAKMYLPTASCAEIDILDVMAMVSMGGLLRALGWCFSSSNWLNFVGWVVDPLGFTDQLWSDSMMVSVSAQDSPMALGKSAKKHWKLLSD
uniref:aECM cysteine-cradle domain-containing protein n=1 Tax=Ditylenchus dipsaci TaxID=166011 RepID=A0A915EK84_9BILA